MPNGNNSGSGQDDVEKYIIDDVTVSPNNNEELIELIVKRLRAVGSDLNQDTAYMMIRMIKFFNKKSERNKAACKEFAGMFEDVHKALDNINKKVELLSGKQKYDIANIEERQQYLNFVNLIFDVQEYAVTKAIDKFRDVLEYEEKISKGKYAVLSILFEIAAPIAVAYIFKGLVKAIKLNGVNKALEAQKSAESILMGLNAKLRGSKRKIRSLSSEISKGAESVKRKQRALEKIRKIHSVVGDDKKKQLLNNDIRKRLKRFGVKTRKELVDSIAIEKKKIGKLKAEKQALQELPSKKKEQVSIVADVSRDINKRKINLEKGGAVIDIAAKGGVTVFGESVESSNEVREGQSDVISSVVTLYRKTVRDDILRAKAEVVRRVSADDYSYGDVCDACEVAVPILDLVDGSFDVAVVSEQIASYHLLLMLSIYRVKEEWKCERKCEIDDYGVMIFVLEPPCKNISVVKLSDETLKALSKIVYVVPDMVADSELRPTIKEETLEPESPITYSEKYPDNACEELKNTLLTLNKMIDKKISNMTK